MLEYICIGCFNVYNMYCSWRLYIGRFIKYRQVNISQIAIFEEGILYWGGNKRLQ